MKRPALSSSTARSALTLVSRQHLWPANRRHPGIANGWQGSAWVAFKLASAGVAVPERVFESIGRHLAVELEQDPRPGYLGAMIGCAADAVVAAYAVSRGVARAAVARAACRRVLSVSRTSQAWDLHMG
ncbi:MAG TPA: hypothetical protein VFT22_06105, partial [Kofleriaceae bacterium]|nr:hypothetical protein [Kofleriaceae bacterium]